MKPVPTAPPLDIMMLPSRHYVSEHTRFIGELLANKPDLARGQQQGRAIWWDKSPQDLALRQEMDAGRVPQSPYVYQNE
jgi:hypothetical protein